ncbi:hypothetical protein CDL12_07363 [Handroanthus impetiginosus]|uniref:Uncharacterized protein n=1 Tax=Handroanthus impetiginosus TaxID=429701 RepID=A0A2G9HQZ5_9LAMI|nr:hypothetical protein CDL12_07363 [Handroanthus impetiginosus]
MAAASLSALHLHPLSRFSSTHAYNFPQISLHVPFLPHYKALKSKSLTHISFALTESSGSPKFLDPDPQILLQELADCFVLPADYFQQLPRDLRLDDSYYHSVRYIFGLVYIMHQRLYLAVTKGKDRTSYTLHSLKFHGRVGF